MKKLSVQQLRAREEKVLAAAVELLVETPFHPVTLAQIAQRSRVNQTAVLREFRTGNNVFVVLFLREYQRFSKTLLSATKPFRPEAVRTWVIRYAQQEALFAHLSGMMEAVIRPKLTPTVAAKLTARYTELRTETGKTLEERVPFFLPGDGVEFLDAAAAVFAQTHMQDAPPEFASRSLLSLLAGKQAQFARRQAAMAKRKPLRWGDFNPEQNM